MLLSVLASGGCADLPDARWIGRSDVVFIGDVAEMGPAPRGYSGAFVSYQTVTYRIRRILKGVREESTLKVFYPIWGDNEIEESGRPALSKRYFREGRVFIVFASVEEQGKLGRRLKSVGLLPHSARAEVWTESKIKDSVPVPGALKQ